MPIFSTNRVSGASTRVVAAEGYTDHDFGRILSECYTNDMKVFNMNLSRDFQEAKAFTENTMVKSELRAFQEFSIKEAWKGLVEKVKKLWAKIKGVFRNVYAKLSVWLNRSNKLYVAQNRKHLETKGDLSNCPIPKYRIPKVNITKKVEGVIKEMKDGVKDAKDSIDKAGGMEASIKADLKSMKIRDLMSATEDKIATSDEMYKEMEKNYFKEPSSSAKFKDAKITVTALLDRISGSSEILKSLKKVNKEFDGMMSDMIKTLNKMSSESENKSAKSKYEAMSKMVSQFQTLTTNMVSATIKIYKKAISNDRGLVAALVAYDPKAPKNENALLCEFAFSAGVYALKEETDDMTEEDIEDAAAPDEDGVSVNIEIEGPADVNVDDDSSDDSVGDDE